jgi:hypothetical protein
LAVERLEQAGNFLRIGGVAGMGLGAGFLGERGELVGLAGGHRNGQPVLGEQAGQRGAEAGAGADDQAQSGIQAFA